MASRAECVSVGAALDLAAQQCVYRHLEESASWLSELALSAESSILEAPARHELPSSVLSGTAAWSSPLRHETASSSSATGLRDKRTPSTHQHPPPQSSSASSQRRDPAACVSDTDHDGEAWLSVLHMDEVLTLPIDHVERLLTMQYREPREDDAGDDATSRAESRTRLAMQRVARWRRLHRVALVLLSKGEFQRCHHLLAKAIQEDTTTAAAANPTCARTEDDGAGTAAADLTPSASLNADEPGASSSSKSPSSLPSAARHVPFGLTSTPSCLQFLCLYALFLDGQRTATTSSAAGTYHAAAGGGVGIGGGVVGGAAAPNASLQRAVNPHLRLLRGMLLEALGNTTNMLPIPTTTTTTTTAACDGSTWSATAGAAPSSPESPGGASSAAGSPHQPPYRTPLSSADARTAQRLVEQMYSSQTRSSDATATTTTTTTARAASGRPSVRAEASAGAAPGKASGSPGRLADPYLCWLLGVVLRDLGMKQESAPYLLGSLQTHPLLWCAWQDLASLVSRDNQLDDIVHALLPQLSATVAATSLEKPATNTAAKGVGVLALMVSIFLAHTRAALGTAPTPTPVLLEAAGLPYDRHTDGNQTDQGPAAASPDPPGPATTSQTTADEEDVAGSERQQQPHQQEPQRSSTASRTMCLPPPPGSASPQAGGRGGGAAAADNPITATAAMAEHNSFAGLTTWELLLRDFPQSSFLLQQLAGYHYHQRRDLDLAQRLYERLLRNDPYRLEGTTDYSNILFMRSDRLSLSSLAQRCYQLDPFRAESNFVVGNYYVLLRQHERSVTHFRRAVVIQPRFMAAWTLLGHAYLETKNTTAAVEAYGVAVQLDPRDYRGWYNLGQVYELLQAYHHALYYYWHTTSLRPGDPRMWTAVAHCLEHDGRLGESVVCLARAEACESPAAPTYPALVRRVAEYYISESNAARACVYLQKLVSAQAATADDLLFALPFLVQQRLREVERLVEMPARSPSYDSAVLRHGGGGGGGGGLWGAPAPSPQQPHPRQSSASLASGGTPHGPAAGLSTGAVVASGSRVDRALTLLGEVDAYLGTIEQLDTGDVTLGVDSSAAGALASPGARRGERSASALSEFVAARRRDVQMNRSLIQYSCGAHQ